MPSPHTTPPLPFKRRMSEIHISNASSSISTSYTGTTPSINIKADNNNNHLYNTTKTQSLGNRRTFWLLLLIAATCASIQFTFHGTLLSKDLLGSSFAGSSGEDSGTSSSLLPSWNVKNHQRIPQLPYTQGHFTLQEPSYEILVLQTSLQHQNDTWKNTFPSKADTEWFIQSLAWIRVKDGGIRPPHESISAFCKDGSSSSASTSSSSSRQTRASEDNYEGSTVRATIDVLWTDPKDRGIGQDLLLFIECPATIFLEDLVSVEDSDIAEGVVDIEEGNGLFYVSEDERDSDAVQQVGAQSTSVHTANTIETSVSRAEYEDIIKAMPSILLDFAIEIDLGKVETTSSGPVPFNLWYVATDVETNFVKYEEPVKMAVCLSPAFYGGGPGNGKKAAAAYNAREGEEKAVGRIDHQMPLLRWIEWREHMKNLGVDRVNWYGRDRDMIDYVEAYNAIQGTKDIFRWAPPLGQHSQSHSSSHPYHDQDAYLSECVMANRLSSDYLLLLDYDEFPMINFDLDMDINLDVDLVGSDNDSTSESDGGRDVGGASSFSRLAQQWLGFMEDSLPDDRGSWEMTRIPMSKRTTNTPLNDDVFLLDQLDCVNGFDNKVKSFYRSKSVYAVNQHKKARMYPIGEEIAKAHKAKPERPYWEHGWDSSKEDVWPKLFHYRWYKNPAENGCTSLSPMAHSKGFMKYMNKLREQVLDVKVKIELELGYIPSNTSAMLA